MTTNTDNRLGRWRVAWAIACLAIAAATLATAGPASAIEITSFDATLSDYQAGGHPDSEVSFRFATEPADGPLGAPGSLCGVNPCQRVKGGAPKDIVVDLPEGIYAAAHNAPRCSMTELFSPDGSATSGSCPVGSQVGIADTYQIRVGRPGVLPNQYPVYQLEPDQGEVARFGFRATGVMVSMSVRLRNDGDYRLQVASRNVFDGFVLYGADVRIWGVPNDSSHNFERAQFGASYFDASPAGARMPFMVAPTECGVDGITSLRTHSWQDLDNWAHAESTPRQVTGCEKLTFNPTADVSVSEARPDSATGLDFKLSMPQHFDDPAGLESPPLRDATVRLPAGMSINPAAADGLEACSDEQLGLGSGSEVSCPFGSKIGSVVARTPVLDEEVEGSVYVRSQNSGDPESGEMFRLALVLENEERGILVKLPGSVRADSGTGRLEATFLDNPQLPVSEIEVSLKGGPRAPLALPAECGEHRVEAELSAWSGHRVTRYDSFEVDCGPKPFAPSFGAGTVSATGGSFSPLVAEIARRDGEAFLSGVDVGLPKGLVAKLAGVELCPDAVAGDGSAGVCPAGSRIGTATVGAGSGDPFYLQGGVYLTGPYGGGPYGLAVQVPAKAGPFDLGVVKVRQAIHVDPETAEIGVASDRLPQIVSGVPTRIRDIHVVADRPDFTVNPTSCSEKRVDATLTAIDGRVHEAGERFQAGDCQTLGFKPRMAMRLSGKGQTRTGAHPGFKTVLVQKQGQAGIGRVKVTMPRSIVLDPNNSTDPALVCDYDKSLRADCPQSSVIGRAVAYTPLLNKPLAGDVHLVQGIRFGPTGNRIRTTPALLVKLRGEVDVNLRGQTTTQRGTNRLVTTFPNVPDAPVSRFSLQVNGGSKGILTVTRTRKATIDICTAPQVADVQTDGQNGKQADYRTRIKTPCPKQAKRAKHHRN